MTIRRGEVYRYEPVAVEDDDPGGLLAVPIGDQGWVSVVRIERLLPSRLTERLYVASPDELDQIATAMRAAFDL